MADNDQTSVELDGEWNTIDLNPKKEEEEKIEVVLDSDNEEDEEVQNENPEDLKGAEKDKAPKEPESKDPPELEGVQTKGAEKRIRKLVSQRKELESRTAQMEQKLKEYEARLKAKEKEAEELREASFKDSSTAAEEAVEMAAKNLEAAMESGVAADIVSAQRQLNAAQVRLGTLKTHTPAPKQETQEPAPAQQPAQQPVTQTEADPKAMAWAAKNEDWFMKDRVRTGAALAIDAQLKEEGFDPDDDDYYEEVDKRLASAFPQYYNNNNNSETNTVPASTSKPQDKEPTQVVAGKSRGSGSSKPAGSRKVTLTQEDVQMAKTMGITLEAYAAQKVALEQAGEGEYIPIKTSRGA